MTALSPLLYSLAQASSPRLILALRPQDPLPDWITHVIHLGPGFEIIYQGTKDLMDFGTAIAKGENRNFIGMSSQAFIIL